LILNNENGKVGTEQLALAAVGTLVLVGNVWDVVSETVHLIGNGQNMLRTEMDADTTSLAIPIIDYDHRRPLPDEYTVRM